MAHRRLRSSVTTRKSSERLSRGAAFQAAGRSLPLSQTPFTPINFLWTDSSRVQRARTTPHVAVF